MIHKINNLKYQFILTIILIFCIISSVNADNEYLNYISQGLDYLALGNTSKSIASFNKSSEYDANNPLLHVCLAASLLMGGKTELAQKEFYQALAYDENCSAAYYGLGIIELSKKNIEAATKHFIKAQSLEKDRDLSSSIEYIKTITWQHYIGEDRKDGDELLKSVNSIWMMRSDRYDEALNILSSLVNSNKNVTCREKTGFVANFLPNSFISINGTPYQEKYVPLLSGLSRLPTVVGRVTLRADSRKARDVSLVSFFINNKFSAVTNSYPYEYIWDTTKYSNGLHIIRIEGTASDGYVLTKKTLKVVAKNKSETNQPRQLTDIENQVWAKLWNVISIKPSDTGLNFNLSICANKSGDKALEITALERTVGLNVNYLDSQQRLRLLYYRQVPVKFYGYKESKQKIFAITFDDGPKPDIVSVLDTLKQKNVRATFFVVGSQVELHSDILMRIKEDGHEIGSHTYNHKALDYLTEKEIVQELFRTISVIKCVTGDDTRLVRPPGGRVGTSLFNVAKKFGLTTVLWTINCNGKEGTSKEKLVKYVLASARPGAILLMHNASTTTILALPEIIDKLREDGYEFVTVTQLLDNFANLE